MNEHQESLTAIRGLLTSIVFSVPAWIVVAIVLAWMLT